MADVSDTRIAIRAVLGDVPSAPVTAGQVENAILAALFTPEELAPAAPEPVVDPDTGETLPDPTVPRDETHDSIDPATGVLTDEATAKRAALIAAREAPEDLAVHDAETELQTATTLLAEAEAAASADDAAVESARTRKEAAEAALAAAQAADAADDSQEPVDPSQPAPDAPAPVETAPAVDETDATVEGAPA